MLEFLSHPGNSDWTERVSERERRGLKSVSRENFQLEKKGLQLKIVCTLVLIFPGFQPSQPSHPPVPNRSDNALFRILKDNKEYKKGRKEHL